MREDREFVRGLVSRLFAKRIGGRDVISSKNDYNGSFPLNQFVESAEMPRQTVEIKFDLDDKPRIVTFDVKDADEALDRLAEKLGDDISKVKNPKINSQMMASQREHKRVWETFFAKFNRVWVEHPRSKAA